MLKKEWKEKQARPTEQPNVTDFTIKPTPSRTMPDKMRPASPA